jgi:hypothetical protein
MSREITVRYSSIDRFSQRRKFKTLKGAQRFAAKWVGPTPDVSETFGYAVSFDGMGKVTWSGCTSQELFPELVGG